MSKMLLLSVLCALHFMASAQHGPNPEADTSWKKIYRETAPKINDLVHTKLDAKFDYNNSYLNGQVWITLKPHFYPTDTLALDAKGMQIKSVSVVKGTSKTPLKYDYDGMILNIKLDKKYTRNDNYTVFIDYT
ncbi:MAG: M1 family peptidase, partial [Chitinophagaceae bacterium]|nr:M1 family peptidase [Chitinophagaceae bacterium]